MKINVIEMLEFLISKALTKRAPVVIGIAGGSSSGKTTWAKKIQSLLIEEAIHVEQDCYYKDLSHMPLEERHVINFDHPESIDFKQLYKDIASLKKGLDIKQPIYDFKTHSRNIKFTHVKSSKVIILDGILIFSEEKIRDLCDLKIYVETDDDIRILRRIGRDMKVRGRDFRSVHHQYLKTVRPMHREFVETYKHYADIILPGDLEPESPIRMILEHPTI